MLMPLTRKTFDILVVDDEEAIFDMLVHTARSLFPEARFSYTCSSEQTLAYLNQRPLQPPHAVILDIDLRASSNGLDLLAQLYGRFKGEVPVVMLTASTDQQLLYQAYDRGAVAYTHKPEDLPGWKDYVASLRELLLTMSQLRPRTFQTM